MLPHDSLANCARSKTASEEVPGARTDGRGRAPLMMMACVALMSSIDVKCCGGGAGRGGGGGGGGSGDVMDGGRRGEEAWRRAHRVQHPVPDVLPAVRLDEVRAEVLRDLVVGVGSVAVRGDAAWDVSARLRHCGRRTPRTIFGLGSRPRVSSSGGRPVCGGAGQWVCMRCMGGGRYGTPCSASARARPWREACSGKSS